MRAHTFGCAASCLPWAVSVGPPAGETTGNRSGDIISQAIERDTLSWTEPEAARFARLKTKAVQKPHSGLWSVSAVRMVLPNPVETTRKFALSGVAVGVCDGKMAEGMGFEPTVPFQVHTLSKRAPSTTRPPLRGRTIIAKPRELKVMATSFHCFSCQGIE